MTILDKLASALDRRDEVSNQELAKLIIDKNDKTAVKELVDNLNNKDKNIQSDCIKVLYEIGENKISLISPYAKQFIVLLTSSNNRLQWGAMTALSSIVSEEPEAIYKALPQIIDVSTAGSVITKDHCVKILVGLCASKKYEDEAFPLLIEQLHISLTNQLPMYAELALPIVSPKNKAVFIKTLTSRLDDIEKDTKRKRVEKVIAKCLKQ